MTRMNIVLPALVLLLAISSLTAQQRGAEWPQFRGPNRNGISIEPGLAAKGNAKPLWKTNVGIGYSTVSIKNGLLYTIGHDMEKEADTVVCLKAGDGFKVWSHTYPCKTMAMGHGGGTQSTPSVDGDRVWVLNREGHLYCYNATTGKVRFHKNLRKKFRLELPTWGYAASPLVLEEMIVINVGKLIAVNRKGKTIWKTRKNYRTGYSTPVEATIDKRKCLLAFNGAGLILLDRKSGKELGFHPWKTQYDVNVATPVVAGNKVFISSGYNRGCAMVTVSTKGFKPVWESKVMRNHMAGCIFYKGHIYGFDESTFKCLDLDGNVKWAERGIGKAAHLIADNKLVLISSRGDIIIAKATEDRFKELSRTNVLQGGVCWTPPVVVAGFIYCRNSKGDLVCLDYRGKQK